MSRPDGGTRDDPVAAASRAAIAQLELLVTRRLDGVLNGDHRGLLPGPGTEPGEARAYEPGDDVRTMDWSVTARTTVPHIRQTIADRELETWIVVDMAPSLDVEGRHGTKRRLVEAAAATVGFLSAGGGSRVGMVLTGTGRPRVLRATGGRDHVRRLLEEVSRSATTTSPGGTFTDSLRGVRNAARRHGLVVVISDFLAEVDWERDLRVLGTRHEFLAVHVADPLDIALPAVGAALLQDPATGEVLEVDVDDALAADYRRAAEVHRDEVHAALRRCGAPVLALRTDRDWIRDVIDFVGARRQGGLPTGENLVRDLPDDHPTPRGSTPTGSTPGRPNR
ncbi:DUF58 domain-containing protein [Dietzia sp. PP-33]|mgnify:CR=1 FL=1|uniref:DUF58 domain-containing protein n=1 Tax=Dietzia sp. PP-33 TaxID=2957500 RepID=UPI0029B97CB8|nr:DUF58 domain-containing protein [Dietzia sp. PP-33]MDX2355435.1 DUF58 domain-containing protein [Dietzia sp. PP-33]